MKNRSLIAIWGVILLSLTTCTKDCEPTLATCSEAPPANELCHVAFTRWFYDKGKNTCKRIAYGGCSQKGFETEQECRACQCN
ncbi:MAG: hypothetical protein J0L66_05610 [Cytophagales bacterium]|nr:hypothetical protein [Cytophagales bacterium]